MRVARGVALTSEGKIIVTSEKDRSDKAKVNPCRDRGAFRVGVVRYKLTHFARLQHTTDFFFSYFSHGL